ncbi:phospholipid scramblase 2 [Eurytemora carolleeae]|uniref:phospholipid scramblase 2 n=1 Tax=Eurytemora carolleeae TaxID=1294199 RepID=UPI000C76FC20|nr:phospholipid scramblase 2 [Eurytemora carolleeae]|eukprot:XP_023334965.1 phospholipid scramblase 2-like [Eurytemora affinis]
MQIKFSVNRRIFNPRMEQIFVATESSDCLIRNCFLNTRPFEMSIVDNTGNLVMHIERPLKCDDCCWFCCMQELEMFDPAGEKLYSVEQEWAFFNNKIALKDGGGEVLMRIHGEVCVIRCCSDRIFSILTPDLNQIGEIRKKWSGCGKETFTEADNFTIEFPVASDSKTKMGILGATILVNYMYFEKKGGE